MRVCSPAPRAIAAMPVTVPGIGGESRQVWAVGCGDSCRGTCPGFRGAGSCRLEARSPAPQREPAVSQKRARCAPCPPEFSEGDTGARGGSQPRFPAGPVSLGRAPSGVGRGLSERGGGVAVTSCRAATLLSR